MPDPLFVSPTDRDMMIRTVMGEAQGQGMSGQMAVANVIANRLASGQYGPDATSVVLAPGQFEPWSNRGAELIGYDPNSDAYRQAASAVDGVLSGKAADNTGGATHFYAPALQSSLGRSTPQWAARGGGQTIGDLIFFAPQGKVVRPSTPAAPTDDATTPTPSVSKSMASAKPSNSLDALAQFGIKVDGDNVTAAGVPAPAPVPPLSRAASKTAPQPDIAFASPSQTPQAPAAQSLDALKAWGIDPATLDTPPAAPTTARSTSPGGIAALVQSEITGKPFAGGSKEPISINDAARSLATGVPIIGGLANKADAALNATLAPAMNSLFAPADQLQGDTWSDRYNNSLQQQQGMDADFAKRHPVANTALNVTGGMAATAPLMAAAPAAFGISRAPVLARVGAGGITNALLGGADATSRGQNPIAGASLGAVLGGAAPGLGAGIGYVGRSIGNLANSGVDGMGRPAVNLLTSMLGADTPEAVQAAAQRLGPQAVLPDLGPSMGGLAQGLAIKPGDAKTALFNVLEQRAAGANGRITSDLNQLLGPAEDPQAVTNAMMAHRSATDAANYGLVHAQGAQVDPSNVVSLIDRHLGTPDNPIATGAQRTALQNLRNGLVAREAVPATEDAAAQPATYRTGSEYLHNLRQELDGLIDGSAPGLGVPAGALNRAQGSITAARGALDSALKSQVPGMAEADAASAAMARRIQAVSDGTGILANGKTAATPDAFAQTYADMAPGEQIALNKGARGEINRLVGTASNDPAKLRNMLQGEGGWNTAKLATAFGDEPVNQLVNAVGREGEFGQTMNKVIGNSQTAQRSVAANLLKDTDPQQINLLPTNWTGLALQAAKKGIYDPAYRALLAPNNGPRDAQLGRALALQGPARDHLINQLITSSQDSARNAVVVAALNRNVTGTGNLLLGGYRGTR